jgi:hypothetical protein
VSIYTTSQFDVPTSLTPTPNHLLCFHFVSCMKEVINLINHPVVSVLDTRLGGTTIISRDDTWKKCDYLHQNTKRTKPEGKKCHTKTMISGKSDKTLKQTYSVYRLARTHREKDEGGD